MATRSLNKAMLIGNLTRDPELRYTPAGTAVCSFGLATNRGWTTEAGEKREEAEFHRIVAWNKLAELCSQLLAKGRKVYVEGRLQTRSWQGQDGNQRTSTEIVIEDMIILDSRRILGEEAGGTPVAETPAAESPAAEEKPASPPDDSSSPVTPVASDDDSSKKKKVSKTVPDTDAKTEEPVKEEQKEQEINPDDIPF